MTQSAETVLPPRPAAGSPPIVGFSEALARVCDALERVGAVGVLAVDASPLEAIERDYGTRAFHSAMDTLAELVVDACGDALGPDDVVARKLMGTDEVIVFLPRPRGTAGFYDRDLPALGRLIDESIQRHANRIVYPYRRTARFLPVGHALALHNPTHRAERQLHDAVRQARREAALDAELGARERRRTLTQLVLAEGITSLYEPIVNLTTRAVLGYEALARGPSGELQSPGALFAMAEEADLVFEVDCLCRRAALRGARGISPGKKLFLNCLPTAIHDPSFRGDTLRRTLEELRLRPSDFVFEISEKKSIDNFAIFREARDHYASLGFQIALDDTGVGYSSLEAVMELSPDYIKVDLSLVRSIDMDPPRQELLRALHSVAEKIDAQIIAEGIESSEELETLRTIGIPFGQGYLLGRAAPLRRER